jgi:hypothetical protein
MVAGRITEAATTIGGEALKKQFPPCERTQASYRFTSVQLCSEVIMQYDNSRDAAVQLRLGSLFDLVENWRRSQAKIPPRSEAIRELVRRAIEADQQHAAS